MVPDDAKAMEREWAGDAYHPEVTMGDALREVIMHQEAALRAAATLHARLDTALESFLGVESVSPAEGADAKRVSWIDSLGGADLGVGSATQNCSDGNKSTSIPVRPVLPAAPLSEGSGMASSGETNTKHPGSGLTHGGSALISIDRKYSRLAGKTVHEVKLATHFDQFSSAMGWQKPKYDAKSHIEPPKVRRLPFGDHIANLMDNSTFVACLVFVIIGNAIFICATADVDVRHAFRLYDRRTIGKPHTAELPPWHGAVEPLFAFIFTVELGLRIWAEETAFLCGNGALWNVFDSVLVLSALLEEVPAFQNLSYLRLLRVTRALRAIRVLRVVRYCSHMRLMLISVTNSVLPLLWAFLFLFLAAFMFGMVFLHGVTEYVNNAGANESFVDEFLRGHFDGILITMLSLFTAITGGMDWWDLGEALFQVSALMGTVFFVYFVFMTFGVLNIIIGIFVESANSICQTDRDLVVASEIDRKESYANHIKEMFAEIDENRSGTISWAELQHYIQDERVVAYFDALELDITEAIGLFKLLDIQGTNEVSIDEFVVSCLRLKGGAKTVDLTTLQYENKKQISMFHKFRDECNAHFEFIEAHFQMVMEDRSREAKSMAERLNRFNQPITLHQCPSKLNGGAAKEALPFAEMHENGSLGLGEGTGIQAVRKGISLEHAVDHGGVGLSL